MEWTTAGQTFNQSGSIYPPLKPATITEDVILVSRFDRLSWRLERRVVYALREVPMTPFDILKVSAGRLGIPKRLGLNKLLSSPVALKPLIHWISGTKKDVRGRL
ncbi:hypothetical protein CD58_04020 [Pseudomonas brassicacearum]|nr:hypothetical protein CD58_04020 [Pseudomonas brassicacearum]